MPPILLGSSQDCSRLPSPKQPISIDELPLDVKAEMALKEAVADALAEHKLRGHPIAVWRDGKVIMIPPEEVVVPHVPSIKGPTKGAKERP